MENFKVQMSDGVVVTVKGFQENDAMRIAEVQTRGQAFGSRALHVIKD